MNGGAVFSALVSLSVLTSAAAGQAGEDWPGFLGPRRDGKSTERGILLEWPPAGLPLLWQRAVGEGYGMPSVARGRLYHFDRVGDRARLTCVRSTTGEQLWQVGSPTRYEDYYGYSGGPRASPLVDDDRVYTFGVDGWLRCRRSEDGALLWEVDTAARFGVVQNFFGAGSSPIVEGDLLIAQIGGSPPGAPSIHSGVVVGNGTGVVAFDKRSGEVRYRFSNELASYSSPVVTTIGDRRWALVFARGGLLGFEPATGRQDFFYPWRARRLESVNAATPVVVGNEVLITESYGAGGSLLRVGEQGYEIVWQDGEERRPVLACHWSTPVYHQGYIYASSGEKSGAAELRCLDWKTGEIQWSQSGLRRSTLLYVDDHFVVLTEYGQLLLIRASPESFKLVASSVVIDTQGKPLIRHPVWSAPILAHGILYLLGEGRLVALQLIRG